MLGISLKQLFKRPVKVLLFLLLIIVAVTFLSLGINLFASTRQNLEAVEGAYRTIGTIEQNTVGYSEKKYWNALTGKYTYISVPEYGAPINVADFDFAEADYIHPPVNRPFFYTSIPEYPRPLPTFHSAGFTVCEYEIVAIYDDMMPVEARITKVLCGGQRVGNTIWLCQHLRENPQTLEVGKTYVSGIETDYEVHPNLDQYTRIRPVEPYMPLYSGQIDETGKLTDDPAYLNWGYDSIFEVTDGFYETDVGKRVLLYAGNDIINGLILVIPTDSTDLLLSFYDRESFVREGRDITPEEYGSGTKVCLIPETHAEAYGLSIGDSLTMNFKVALFGSSPGRVYTENTFTYSHDVLYNTDNAYYDAFQTDTYEIVGLYKSYGGSSKGDYHLGYGSIVIPAKSIQSSYADHMAGNMILQPYNVVFEIPNGTSGAYMKQLEALGLADAVTVTFYDRGYENIKAGIMNIRSMAAILLIVGVVTTLAVLFFFAFIFISKQKKRTAIERSLGISKKRCALSLFAGVLLIIIVGAGAGVCLGFFSGSFVEEQVTERSQVDTFDTRFSNWVNNADMAEADGPPEGKPVDIKIPVLLFISVLFVAVLIVALFIWSSLKQEPLRLLSRRET